MKVEYKVVIASVICGLFMWVIDAVVDYMFFFQGTFWESMITAVAPHDAYARVLAMVVFPVFGIFIAIGVSKMRRLEEALEDSEKALRGIIDFNQILLNAIPFGMRIVDDDGNILFMNKRMSEMTDEKVTDKKCWDFLVDDKVMRIGCPLTEDMKQVGSGAIEEKTLDGDKTFKITPIGIIYEDKNAILEIYQEVTKQEDEKKPLEGDVK